MTTAIEDANELLRAAVEMRREAQAAGKPHEEWYDVSQPVTKPMPEVAKAEDLQHVEWDRMADEPYIDHLLEQQRLRGPSAAEVLERFAPDRPGSLPFLELLEELRQLHFEKTSQYGGVTDPFENVTASTKCGVEPWRRALCDLSDCVVRMQRYANGQPVDYENALIDAANWSLICLLKLRESKR